MFGSASPHHFRVLINMTRLFLIAVLIAAAFGQSDSSFSPPEHFEYMQGHGLGGHDLLTWENGKLVSVGVPFNEEARKTVERYEPSPQAWEHFWKNLDAANVWKWKAEYPSAINITDAEGWSVELRHAGRSVQSQGYNSQPPEFGAFCDAVNQLIKESKKLPPSQ